MSTLRIFIFVYIELIFAIQTVSAVEFFFLAMAMYPEVQKRAQLEIDTVIGNHRLPDFSDRYALPYINATIKETMRWQSVTPLCALTLFIQVSAEFDYHYSSPYVHCGR